MLRRSVYALRYAAILLGASIVFYFIRPEWGVYFIGVGLMSMALATVLYIIFMFKRYGDKKPIE